MAIFVKDKYKIEELSRIGKDIAGVEWAGCRLITDEGIINFIGVYRAPRGTRTNFIDWKKLVNGINRKEGIVVAGDFNAHNRIWNCENSDKLGEDLFEEFLEEDLFIVNKDTESRMGEKKQKNSNIDLIFCSDNICDKVGYEQGDDTWGSEHFPIRFDIKANGKDYKKLTNRISRKKTDWDEYRNVIQRMGVEAEDEWENILDWEIKYNKIKNIMILKR